ncbi:BatA domain-containing protein [Haloferula sargassicola]|uniref:Aerotolerance regulator N-terminal domain-containing protein n=1 Tax=Haloferula sargassicola TaxID=490096 RepID=A0ABP9UV48_9BACT
MVLLSPTFLWLALAAIIPIAIHLLNRRRHRTVKWAAMQFLLKASRETRGKKRLRHILILTCRALALAALAFAAAQPVIGGFFGLGAGKPDVIVVIFDRSASMEASPLNTGNSRREIAIGRLKGALDDFSGSRIVLIDSASGTPQELPSPEVLDELSTTAGTDTEAHFPALLARAAEYLIHTQGRSEIWVVSDLQASNWRPEDGQWEATRAALTTLPQPPRIRILGMVGRNAANQAIRALGARRAGDSLVLSMEIVRTDEATQPITLPLSIQMDGAVISESVAISGQQLQLQKTVPVPADREQGHGWVSLPGDGNLRDNVAFFAYGPARPVKSLVVGDPGEASTYLTLAAAPDGFGGQSATLSPPQALPELSEISTVFWSAPLPAGEAAKSLERFLDRGGQVVFFPPEADEGGDFLQLAWQATTESQADQFFILSQWDHGDGLLRDSLDGTPIPADRLRSIRRRVPTGEAAVLASWDDGQPFLTRRVIGDGVVWMVGTRPDYTWSNLGDADVLLPLAQRAVEAGSKRFETGLLAEVGSRRALGAGNEAHERVDRYPQEDRAAESYLAGVFRTGDGLLAVNRPADEDVVGVLDEPTLDLLFEGTDHSLFEDQRASAADSLGRPVWQALMVAMLLFLLSEALLCLPKKAAAEAAQTASTGHLRSFR